MNDGLHQIGEVAERVGLSLRSVRYYEEQGLLVPESRTEGGFRLYSEQQIERLSFIKEMKPLGFTVQQMRELLDARDALQDPSAGARAREQAAARVREFAELAAQRYTDLSRQLERATELARRLRREARAAAQAARAG